MIRWLSGLALLIAVVPARADDLWTRERDVIYGRKYGLAMTMDVFRPKEANGLGVLFVVSGGWFSDAKHISPLFATPFLNRGYTVFEVVHGSQPKFTIPEIIDDLHRA